MEVLSLTAWAGQGEKNRLVWNMLPRVPLGILLVCRFGLISAYRAQRHCVQTQSLYLVWMGCQQRPPLWSTSTVRSLAVEQPRRYLGQAPTTCHITSWILAVGPFLLFQVAAADVVAAIVQVHQELSKVALDSLVFELCLALGHGLARARPPSLPQCQHCQGHRWQSEGSCPATALCWA